ncbi:MAG TPA: transglutaminase-like domain-containing protein [Patescibacteria group bacterium]|nr:transglutaminase-like domain-containing protein [Patescibacteria group bacterium]
MRIKRFFLLLLALFLFSFGIGNALAQVEFLVDSEVNYNVQDSGKTIVTHDITLENNFSTLYATSYTLSLQNIESENITAKDSQGVALQTEVKEDGEFLNIKVTFADAVVGKGEKRNFFISYENSNFAVRTGEVWEITIPRMSEPDSFRSYKVNLTIPASFGSEAYISPQALSKVQNESGITYLFGKEQIVQSGVTAGFGQFQVFSFNLSYHLENPLPRAAETEIALPPDTAFQKVYITTINPKPKDVKIDPDGNWLAVYSLKPRERVDVIVNGSVQIFAGHRPFPKPTEEALADNLKETEFWQVNDPAIRQLASQYKTAREIYDYVTTNLKYDLSRVQPNVQRMGAVAALSNKEKAICMEYTDLFIAIARAAGIPAREVNGFAYTENPDLQPLGLVADVLHSWPEYYDSQKGAWIPIDPTWGSTTGGVDFFNKLDLRHFAFVVHGQDSIKPYPPGSYKLGSNPQKDVYVTFGKLPAERVSKAAISAQVVRNIPFFHLIYSVTIKNQGPAGLYSIYPTVYFDGKEESRDFIDAMPPYSNYTFRLSVPFSLLGEGTPQNVKITVDGSEITVPTNKRQAIINSAIALFVFLGAVMMFVLIRLKKISFKPFFDRIRAIYGKIFKKSPPDSVSP